MRKPRRPPEEQKKLQAYQRRNPHAHGGELRCFRRGRGARPLGRRYTMHFVLRSSRARGDWSFRKGPNERKVLHILRKFSAKHGVELLRCVNVGNHLHLHLRVQARLGYNAFIRAVTSAIARAVAGTIKGFWDRRPFSRLVAERGLRILDRYLRINVLQSLGYSRADARFFAEKGFG